MDDRQTDRSGDPENRILSIIKALPSGIHMYRLESDNRLVFIASNPAADRILGVDNTIFIGKTIEEAFPLLKATDIPQRYREVAVTGKPWFTEQVEYDEGNIKGAFEVHAFQIAPNMMAAVFEDITVRKQAELALKQSEAKYRRLYNETPILLHSIDRSAIVVEVNDYWLQVMGYERKEVINRKVTDFYTDASRKYAEEIVQTAFFRDGYVKDIPYQFVKKNGDVIDVLLSATAERDADGTVVRSLAVIKEITEQKQLEEMLRSNQERYQVLSDAAFEAIAITEEGRFLDANRQMCDMIGYTIDEIKRMPVVNLIAPEDRELVRHNQSIGSESPYENRLLHKNGTIILVESRARHFTLNNRRVRVTVLRDITDKKKLEQEVIKTQKLESIGTLAGGIAHDFNNLLQGIFGYIALAKMTIDQKDKAIAMLDQAEKALHQSVNLTTQLLTFSKGGKPLKKVLSLRPIIENAVSFSLSGSRVDHVLLVDENIRPIDADEGQIAQVIQNIVINAEQSMPLGGRIEIAVRNTSAQMVEGLSGDLRGDLVEITVRDQGTGIPPEHLPRIFDPYFTTKERGSGLGLATSYSIIKNHGGVIQVSSELGKGSTFTIYLPASISSVVQGKASQKVITGRKGRILVMDDEEIVREVANAIISSLGYEVELAEHGDSAISHYCSAREAGNPFDLVMLDLTIKGGMGGLETCEKLLEIDPALNAVVSSGYSDDAGMADYQSKGFKAFLKKPYSIENLSTLLSNIIS